MMLREAVPGVEAEIEAFLAGHPATSMLLRSNLHAFGLTSSDDPRACRAYEAIGFEHIGSYTHLC